MVDDQENLLMNAPCGIFSSTEDGVITKVNAYCCQLLGYEQSELTGLNLSCLLTISGRIFYQTHFYPIVKLHRKAEEIFLILQAKSKKDIPVILNAVALETEGVYEILCSFIPVFNRRKYEDEILLAKKTAEDALQKNQELEKVKRELEFQQKALDKQIKLLTFRNKELLQLNDVVAHDLQEPVRKLILFSAELQKPGSELQLREHALSVIKRSSQEIQTLLLHLQQYLSVSSEITTKEPVSLSEVVETQLQKLKSTHTHITVEAEIEPSPIISGDKKQPSQLFYHLLKNCFEHGVVANKLTLSVHSLIVKENLFYSLPGKYKYVDYVKITITDKGPGFDNRYNDYIFDVLKRLNVTADTLGFGLAFCKRIVENHFGRIKASGSVGNGAVFTLMLPIDNDT